MAVAPGPGMSVGDIELVTPDEETVIFGDRVKVPTIVILARYYG